MKTTIQHQDTVKLIHDVSRGSGRTTSSLRKDVRQMIKQVNRVLYESGDTGLTKSNFEYFLGGEFHKKTSGGITTNISSERLTKADAQRLYNKMAMFINADTNSYQYKDEMTKKQKQMYKRFKSTMRERYGKRYSDEQLTDIINLQSQFPELFDASETFYLQALDMSRSSRKNEISMIDAFLQAKKELTKTGEPYTTNELKKRAFEIAQYKPKKSYTP